MSTAVSPTEEIAVTASADGSIAIWDISKMPRLVNKISGPGIWLFYYYLLVVYIYLFIFNLLL